MDTLVTLNNAVNDLITHMVTLNIIIVVICLSQFFYKNNTRRRKIITVVSIIAIIIFNLLQFKSYTTIFLSIKDRRDNITVTEEIYINNCDKKGDFYYISSNDKDYYFNAVCSNPHELVKKKVRIVYYPNSMIVVDYEVLE